MKDAIRILEKILFDATGDIEQPDKRLWPLRAANYREASTVVSDYYASQQKDSADHKTGGGLAPSDFCSHGVGWYLPCTQCGR